MRINFSMQLQLFFEFFLLMQLQFQIFPNIYLCSYSFFLPEFILHQFSVEGYARRFRRRHWSFLGLGNKENGTVRPIS